MNCAAHDAACAVMFDVRCSINYTYDLEADKHNKDAQPHASSECISITRPACLLPVYDNGFKIISAHFSL